MHINAKKVIWGTVAAICVLGLAYVWLIGLPVPEYVATNDGADSKVYTLQIAPYTYFDVAMSANEVLTYTDMETFYDFEEGTVAIVEAKIDADIVNAEKQVFGRPNGFLYRVFEESVVQADSELSMYQAYSSLTSKEPYHVSGNFDNLKQSKRRMPYYDTYSSEYPLTDSIWAARDYDYNYDKELEQLLWVSDAGTFYKVSKVYGLQFDTIQQLLSTAKACYGLNIEEYWAGEDYYLFTSGEWVLGVKTINRNTQMLVVTNSRTQYNAALMTLQKGSD